MGAPLGGGTTQGALTSELYAAFLFVSGLECFLAGEESKEEQETEESPESAICIAGLPVPRFDFGTVAQCLPPAMALHSQSLAVASCVPIIVPVDMPLVTPGAWLGDRRARAFHRCCAVTTFTQTMLAAVKFLSGNLVGGVYDLIVGGMGVYAVQQGDNQMLASYVVVSGFAGVISVLGLIQTYPFPIPVGALVPPVISLLSAYFGWEFCRAVKALVAGTDVPQETWLIRVMGSDTTPAAWLTPRALVDQAPRLQGVGSLRPVVSFQAFAGRGHQLGSDGSPT